MPFSLSFSLLLVVQTFDLLITFNLFNSLSSFIYAKRGSIVVEFGSLKIGRQWEIKTLL